LRPLPTRRYLSGIACIDAQGCPQRERSCYPNQLGSGNKKPQVVGKFTYLSANTELPRRLNIVAIMFTQPIHRFSPNLCTRNTQVLKKGRRSTLAGRTQASFFWLG